MLVLDLSFKETSKQNIKIPPSLRLTTYAQNSRNIPRIKKTALFHQDNVNLLLRCRNPEVQLANMEVERKVIDLTKVSRGGTKEKLNKNRFKATKESIASAKISQVIGLWKGQC